MKNKKIETLKEQLKEAGREILVFKQEVKKHGIEKVHFEKMRKIWEDQVISVSKTLDNIKKLMKCNQTLTRGEVKHVRRMNLHLQSINRALKEKLEDLQEQLDLIHVELEKKGLKMTVVEEPIS